MKRKMLIPLLLSLALAMSGCGGGGTTAGGASTSSETAASASTTEGTETVKVPDGEATDINILALKGPTAMGMVNMMDAADKGELTDNNYHFTIASAVDEVGPAIAKGEADIAAVPANLASVLFNNTDGAVQALTINTLGVLYILENGEAISSVGDLSGKTVYASGKGATPEYALNHILIENGIDPESDVTIEWKSEHAECLAALLADEDGVAMLPQPFVTTAQVQNEGLRVALDLTEEWDKLQEGAEETSSLITGATIVRTEFAKEHPEAVRAFLANYEASVAKAKEDIDGTAALIGAYDIVPEAVAKKALPSCNIVYIDGEEMEEALSGYLKVLHGQNPQAVGGELPGDGFYFK